MKIKLVEANVDKSYLNEAEEELREVVFGEGTSMGDSVYVYKTNAPKELLRDLLKRSNEVWINGGSYDDVPNWGAEITDKGYVFEYVDEGIAVNEDFEPKERYIIENQPELNEADSYRQSELNKVNSGEYGARIKITGGDGETKWLDISEDELKAIKKILLKSNLKESLSPNSGRKSLPNGTYVVNYKGTYIVLNKHGLNIREFTDEASATEFAKKFDEVTKGEGTKDYVKNLKEAGEWDDSDPDMVDWKNKLTKVAKKIAKRVPGGDYEEARGFDAYQGPYAWVASGLAGGELWYGELEGTYQIETGAGWIVGTIDELVDALTHEEVLQELITRTRKMYETDDEASGTQVTDIAKKEEYQTLVTPIKKGKRINKA